MLKNNHIETLNSWYCKLLQLRKDLLKHIISYNLFEEQLQIAKTNQKFSKLFFGMFPEITIYSVTSFKFLSKISGNLKILKISDKPKGMSWQNLSKLNLSSLIKLNIKCYFSCENIRHISEAY